VAELAVAGVFYGGWQRLQIFFQRLKQKASAGDGLTLNRLAMAKNSGGLNGFILGALQSVYASL